MFEALAARHTQVSVGQQQFDQWTQQYSFNRLRCNKRLGQLFCEHYNVQDNLLRFVFDNEQSICYIKKTYIK